MENNVEKQYPVITISREYAAYGRTVAEGLSKRLGIPVYDKDFVRRTANVSGYSEDDVAKDSEALSKRSEILNSVLNSVSSYTSSHDAIFKAQREVILNLAKEPCIIVGRCAECILHEAGVESFDVFLFADLEHRMVRARELENDADADIKKVIAKKDSERSTYYKHYTDKEMGYYKNYDICLDTGKIGVEKCIDILCEILQK